MLPAKQNKVDLSNLTEEERKLVNLYGKLPAKKNPLNKSIQSRKYFDSGDYALSKAGKGQEKDVGTTIPSPENIPHVSPPATAGISLHGSSPTNGGLGTINGGLGTSPVKESGLAKETEMAEEPTGEASGNIAIPHSAGRS